MEVFSVSTSNWFQEKKKEESSDEMSPPSSMDTSSESESDIPLNKLLKKQQAKRLHPKRSPRKSENEVNNGVAAEEKGKPKDVEGSNNWLEENETKPGAKGSTKKPPKTDKPKESSFVFRMILKKGAREDLNVSKKTNLIPCKVKDEQDKKSELASIITEAKQRFVLKNKDILGTRSNLEPVVVIEKYKTTIAPEVIEIDDDSDCEMLSEKCKKEAPSNKGKQTEEDVTDLTLPQTQEDSKEDLKSSSGKNAQAKTVKRKKQARTQCARKSRLKSESSVKNEIEDSS